MVVDAEVNKEQGRPLFGVNEEVCKKVVQKKKKGLDRADIVRDVRLKGLQVRLPCSPSCGHFTSNRVAAAARKGFPPEPCLPSGIDRGEVITASEMKDKTGQQMPLPRPTSALPKIEDRTLPSI